MGKGKKREDRSCTGVALLVTIETATIRITAFGNKQRSTLEFQCSLYICRAHNTLILTLVLPLYDLQSHYHISEQIV